MMLVDYRTSPEHLHTRPDGISIISIPPILKGDIRSEPPSASPSSHPHLISSIPPKPPSPDVIDTSNTTVRNPAKKPGRRNQGRLEPRCNRPCGGVGITESGMPRKIPGLRIGLAISRTPIPWVEVDILFRHVLIAPAK
jgi:hypothetical protein